MKMLPLLIILLSLSSFSLSADNNTSFKTAYAEYQRCLKEKDFICTEKQAKIAYDTGKEVYSEDSKNLAALHYNYGLAVMKMGDRASVIKAYGILQQALPTYEKSFGKKSLQTLSFLVDLTKSQIDASASEQSKKPYWKRAIRLSKALNGDTSLEHAYVLMDISNVLLLGYGYSNKQAKKHATKAYELFLEKLGPKHPMTSYMAFNLGKYQLAKKDYKKAVNHFEDALIGFSTESRNRYAMSTHGFLVEAYEKMGERDKATKHCLAIGAATPQTASADYYPLIKVPPEYPGRAARIGKEGYVILNFSVNQQGFVKNVEVVNWGGSEMFIAPAIEAAENFRYAPQFFNGKPIEVADVKNRFVFIMEK